MWCVYLSACSLGFISTLTSRKRRKKASLIFSFLFLNSKNLPPITAPYSSFHLLVPRRLFKCSQKTWTALNCSFSLLDAKSTPGNCAASFCCLMTNRPASGINPIYWHWTLLCWPWGQLFHFDSTLCNDLHVTEAKLNVRGYINIVQLDWKCSKVRKWKNELPNNTYLPHCWCIMALIFD